MNYDEFKETLQEEIQANVSQPINFVETVSTKVNETLEGIILRLDGENAAPIIYPEKLYEDYQAGIPLSMIADYASVLVTRTDDYPATPQITPENAQKSISFALVNRDKNKRMLETCPYKEVCDLAAVPRWHTDRGSFLVDNDMAQILQMTKEEILNIAQKNTENQKYTCRSLVEVLQEALIDSGMDREAVGQMFPLQAGIGTYVITNQSGIEGSSAVLSDAFLQQVSERIGNDELYLLPSSRHEMLVADPRILSDPAVLRDIVVDVNHNPAAIRQENVLSDSIYKYNAATHTLSVCDSMGLFHDKAVAKDTIKSNTSRGRGRL